MSVRVRFAPSPTGYLHVGGLRTALYNYLFARHHNGTCILRIEDTDRTRFVENAEENLVNSLKWAGVEFDESPGQGGNFGPYVQSERFDLYRDHAKKLIENGSAYYAFDTSDELDQMRHRQQHAGIAPKYDRTVMKNQFTLGEEETAKLLAEGVEYVIRLKVPIHLDIRFSDIIRGEVIVKGKDVDDQILLKSDGFPTYHLANVVDDHFMEISHVIRGEEWLPSTPKHILLYEAFGWDKPQFAHLPLLLNEDKTKLSKRQGDVAVEDYIEKGYFKDAFVNFVALLGWNPTADTEIFSMEELIKTFNLEKVNKSGAIFDRKKLDWTNSMYLRSKDLDELTQMLLPVLEEKNIVGFTNEYISKVIELVRERLTFVKEVPDFAKYMFSDDFEFDPEYKSKFWNAQIKEFITPLINGFKEDNSFNHDSLNEVVSKFMQATSSKFGQVMNPIRLMLTGKSVGASMLHTMEILGKEKCIARFDKFISNNKVD